MKVGYENDAKNSGLCSRNKSVSLPSPGGQTCVDIVSFFFVGRNGTEILSKLKFISWINFSQEMLDANTFRDPTVGL